LGLDNDLKNHAWLKRLGDITDLAKWTQKIRDIDSRHQSEKKWLASDIEEHMSQVLKKMYAQTAQTPASTPTPKSSGPQSSDNDHPPCLTDSEWQLLHEHDGCYKCCKFYTDHHVPTCTAQLSGTDYKPRTLQDALCAKVTKEGRKSNCMATITTITEAILDGSDLPSASSLVAALFLDSTPTGLENKSSFDSIGSLMSQTPLKCDHFMWKCLLDGTSGPLTLTALIDSGAHMVLIHSSIAHKLKLEQVPLATPELVNVAINISNKPLCITHFIHISPTSMS
jgi:hypothetical protein